MVGGSIEFLILLMAGAVLMLDFSPKILDLLNMLNGNTAAWEQRMITSAARTYLQQNFTAAYNAAAGGPIKIALTGANSLASMGYLPSGVATGLNPWQQSTVFVIEQAGTNQVFGYVATIGGNAIPVQYLSNIAKLTNDYGGYVPYATEPNTCSPAPCAKLAGGFGKIDMTAFASLGAAPSAGHLVNGLYFTAGQEIAPYLYRVPGGDPDDNTMHQDIEMNANNVNNALTLNATSKMTSPIYADSNQPATYYLQPAGTSQLYAVDTAGDVNSQGNVYAKHYYLNP